MGNYCHIVDGKLAYAGHLPKDGGLPNYSLEDLIANGWLPMEEIHPAYDNSTHRKVGTDMDIQIDKVVFTDNIVAFTDEEMKQNKWNDWSTKMIESDITDMQRDMECHIKEEHGGVVADSILQEKYDRKIAKRATRPENPTP